MSSLLYLLAAFGLAALGSAVIVLRARQPRSVDAGVKAFSREMRALDPGRRVAGSGGDAAAPADDHRPPGR